MIVRKQITYKQLDALKLVGGEYKNTGLPSRHFKTFSDHVKRHWNTKSHVYYGVRERKGLHTSGQFANSCVLRKHGKYIVISMKNIYSYGSKKRTVEYGQYLRRNVGASKGRYFTFLPNGKFFDRRVRTGVHKGIPNAYRWQWFIGDVKNESKRYLKELIPNTFVMDVRRRVS